MKRSWTGFLCGVMATILLVGLVGTAAATVGRATVNADYNNIKVTMNGTAVNLVDANGNAVEPFAINGTTYLPVRAVADALGLDVGWDGATSTVKLTSKAATANGTLLMDKNDVKIYFTGITEGNRYSGGYKINLRIENKSDKNYYVSVDDFSANGIMVSEYFYCSVAAGKTANDAIEISDSSMKDSGLIGPITSAEFKFSVTNDDDWRDSFASDIIRI